MVGISVRDGGSIKSVNEMHVRDGGSIKEVNTAYVKDGGTIKQCFGDVLALDTTIVEGTDFLIDTWFFTSRGRGYDGGDDWYGANNFGSMADDDYVDGDGNTRVISSVYWSDQEYVLFTIDVQNVPNTDVSWKRFEIGSDMFLRSDLGGYNPTHQSTMTVFFFNLGSQVTNPFSGTTTFKLWTS